MATHWYNRGNYNPAFITRNDYMYVFANARQQWLGVDGAPQVFNIQVSEYAYRLHSGFGLSFVSDKIGLTQVYNPMFTYAYRLDNEREWSLSMGLSAGVFMHYVEGSRYESAIINDPLVQNFDEEEIQPDANAGVEFISEHFVLGVSSTHLFSINTPENYFLNSNHRYGYLIYKNNNLKLLFYKVGLQVVNRNNLTVTEGNLSVRFKHPTGLMKGPREMLDLGVTYRSSQQMTFMLGLLLTPNLRVGYAYDHSFIHGYFTNSTHEVLIEYRLFNKLATASPRCGKEIHWDK
jgi:type IX secretion system PorP/SprF family membrane protein